MSSYFTLLQTTPYYALSVLIWYTGKGSERQSSRKH